MSDMQAQPHVRKGEVSIPNWLGTLILSAIPVVNLILFIVWAFSCKRASKRNYAIAMLILTVICIVLGVLACAFFGEQIAAFCENLNIRALAQIQGATPAA